MPEFCPACGAKLIPDSEFCAACGADAPKAEPESPIDDSPAEPVVQARRTAGEKQQGGNKGILIAVLMLGGLVAAGAAGYGLSTLGSDSPGLSSKIPTANSGSDGLTDTVGSSSCTDLPYAILRSEGVNGWQVCSTKTWGPSLAVNSAKVISGPGAYSGVTDSDGKPFYFDCVSLGDGALRCDGGNVKDFPNEAGSPFSALYLVPQ